MADASGANGPAAPAGSGETLVLKGRFRAVSTRSYGLFVMVCNLRTGFVDNVTALASNHASIFSHEPSGDWRAFESTIQQAKWKGSVNVAVTNDLQETLRTMAGDPQTLADLLKAMGESAYPDIERSLVDVIGKVVGEKNVILETALQDHASQQPAAEPEASEAGGDPAPRAAADPTLPTGAVVLAVTPVLAPVNGTVVAELKLNQKVMVKINPTGDRANHYIDELGARKDREILAVPGEIVGLSPGAKGGAELTVKVAPNVYGRLTADDQAVKLKTYDPATDKPGANLGAPRGKKSQVTPTAKTSAPPYGVFILIGAIFFVGILIVFILSVW